jgi:serine/threonine-protein kinase
MTSDFSRQAFGSFGKLGPGTRVAGYLIEEQVGAGGMAVVFRAHDEVLGRPAAVKVIAPSMADDEEFRARFLRESRAAAAVRSVHIVPVYAAGEADGLLYIATQYVAGGDLATLLRRAGGRLSPQRAASLVTQVASALDAAHAAGLVHRDVKPQNVLIDALPEQPEHAYLADFGLSKGTQSTGLTTPGQFLGTPEYCAPEQIKSDRVDGRTDQYALGCLAFVLLTGSLPFHRQEIVATLWAHLQDPVPRVTALRPELPAAVDGVITRALAKSPADRYARCGEFAAALQQALAPARPATARSGGSWLDQYDALRADEPARSLAASGPPAASRPPWELPAASPRPSATHAAGPPLTTASALPAPAASPRFRRPGKSLVIAAAVATVAVLAVGVVALLGFLKPDPVSYNARVLADASYNFDNPEAMAADGDRIWVINNSGSVTELKATDGSLIQTLSGYIYGFKEPSGIAVADGHVWITNYTGNSVTELNADNGSWIRTISGSQYGFNTPEGIAADGAHLWITNFTSNSVTELNASSGAWIRTISGGHYGFDNPDGITADGTHVWVANTDEGADTLTELNAADGSWVQTLNDINAQCMVVYGGHLWVAGALSVAELSLSDGSTIRTVSEVGDNYSGGAGAAGIVVDGTDIWAANQGGWLTELNARDGTVLRTLPGSTNHFGTPAGIAVRGTQVFVSDNKSVTELTVG